MCVCVQDTRIRVSPTGWQQRPMSQYPSPHDEVCHGEHGSLVEHSCLTNWVTGMHRETLSSNRNRSLKSKVRDSGHTTPDQCLVSCSSQAEACQQHQPIGPVVTHAKYCLREKVKRVWHSAWFGSWSAPYEMQTWCVLNPLLNNQSIVAAPAQDVWKVRALYASSIRHDALAARILSQTH